MPANDNIGSIGNTITPLVDLRDNDEVSAVIYLLASAISARLIKHKLKTRCISICLRDSQFNKVIRQCSIILPTDNINRIFNQAYALFTKHYAWAIPLRSVGIRADNLCNDDQLSLFDLNEYSLEIDMDARIKRLTERFGVLKFEKAATMREW